MPVNAANLGPYLSLVMVSQLHLITEFNEYMRNGPKPLRTDTRMGYHRFLQKFLRMAGSDGKTPLAELCTRANLIRVLCQIPMEQASTRRQLVYAVKTLARFLWDVGGIDREHADEVLSLNFKAKSQPHQPYLEVEQLKDAIRRLLFVGAYDDLERLINVVIFAVLSFTGLRASEFASVAVGEIDLERGLIRVENGKGGRRRTVGINSKLVPLLRLYARHRPESLSDRFFLGPTGRPLSRDLLVKRFARLSKSLGIKVRAHDLRRSFATACANEANVPLPKLQQILGHVSVTTTMLYVKVDQDALANDMRGWTW